MKIFWLVPTAHTGYFQANDRLGLLVQITRCMHGRHRTLTAALLREHATFKQIPTSHFTHWAFFKDLAVKSVEPVPACRRSRPDRKFTNFSTNLPNEKRHSRSGLSARSPLNSSSLRTHPTKGMNWSYTRFTLQWHCTQVIETLPRNVRSPSLGKPTVRLNPELIIKVLNWSAHPRI